MEEKDKINVAGWLLDGCRIVAEWLLDGCWMVSGWLLDGRVQVPDVISVLLNDGRVQVPYALSVLLNDDKKCGSLIFFPNIKILLVTQLKTLSLYEKNMKCSKYIIYNSGKT